MRLLATLVFALAPMAPSVVHAIPSKLCSHQPLQMVFMRAQCGTAGNEDCCGPNISLPGVANLTTSSVTGTFQTDKVEGTAHACVRVPSTSQRTCAEIVTGTQCISTGSSSVTGASTTVPVTGLSENTSYQVDLCHEWDGLPYEAAEVVSTSMFTTLTSAPPPPVTELVPAGAKCISASGSDANDGACSGGTGHWATPAHAQTQLTGVDGSKLYFNAADTHNVTNFKIAWSGTNATTGRGVVGAFYDDAGVLKVVQQDWDWSDNPVIDCAGGYCFQINTEQYVDIMMLDIDGGPFLTDPEALSPASVNSWLELQNADNVRVIGNRMWSAHARNNYDCFEIVNGSVGVEVAYNDIHMCGTHGSIDDNFTTVQQKGDMFATSYDSSDIHVHHNKMGFGGHSTASIRSDRTVIEYNTYNPRLPNGVDGEDTRAVSFRLDSGAYNTQALAHRRILSQANRYINFRRSAPDTGAVMAKFNVTGMISRYEYVDGDNDVGPKADTCCYSSDSDIVTTENSFHNWTIDNGTLGGPVISFQNFAQPTTSPNRVNYENETKNFAVKATLLTGFLRYDHAAEWQTYDSWEKNTAEGHAFAIAKGGVNITNDQGGSGTLAALESSQPTIFANNTGGLADPVTTNQGVDLALVSGGCGTATLTVDRSRWFWGESFDTDGDGTNDVVADDLAVDGTVLTDLSSVDDGTNQLVFGSSVTCTNGVSTLNHAAMDTSGNAGTGIPLAIIPGALPQGETLLTGDEYFVDATNGNDNADGRTHGTAWKTTGKVNSSVTASGSRVFYLTDTVVSGDLTADWGGTSGDLAEVGTYCMDGGTPRRWTAGGEGCGARARLDVATASGSHYSSSTFTRWEGIWLKKRVHPGDTQRLPVLNITVDDTSVHDSIIEGFDSRAEVISKIGGANLNRINGVVNDGRFRISVTDSTFRWLSWNAIDAGRVSRYTGNTLLENYHMGISIGPNADNQDQHVLIADNVCIDSMNEDCIQSNQYFSGPGDQDARKVIVHGNRLEGRAGTETPENGIDPKAGMLWVVEENYVHGWESNGISIGSGTGVDTSDMLFRFNIVYDNANGNTMYSENLADANWAHNTFVGNNRDNGVTNGTCAQSTSRQNCKEAGITGAESRFTNNLAGDSNNVELEVQYSDTDRKGRWHFFRETGTPKYSVWYTQPYNPPDTSQVFTSIAAFNAEMVTVGGSELEASSAVVSDPLENVPEDPTGDPVQYDFNLATGATSINAAEGVSSAATTEAVATTTLTVPSGESCFFTDYWDDENPDGQGTWAQYLADAGLVADYIKIGANTYQQIAATDCGDGTGDDTVTLTTAQTWTSGDAIYYTDSSGNVWDDIGACQTQGGWCP